MRRYDVDWLRTLALGHVHFLYPEQAVSWGTVDFHGDDQHLADSHNFYGVRYGSLFCHGGPHPRAAPVRQNRPDLVCGRNNYC